MVQETLDSAVENGGKQTRLGSIMRDEENETQLRSSGIPLATEIVLEHDHTFVQNTLRKIRKLMAARKNQSGDSVSTQQMYDTLLKQLTPKPEKLKRKLEYSGTMVLQEMVSEDARENRKMIEQLKVETTNRAKGTLVDIGCEMNENRAQEDEDPDTSRQLLLSNSFPQGIPLEEKKRRTM